MCPSHPYPLFPLQRVLVMLKADMESARHVCTQGLPWNADAHVRPLRAFCFHGPRLNAAVALKPRC